MKYSSLILCVIYAAYLCVGGVIFMHVEYSTEEHVVITEKQEWLQLKEIAYSEETTVHPDVVNDLMIWLDEVCWNITPSVVSQFSAEGYGHISPSGALGRVLCILYAMIGVPLTGILLTWTSGFFGEKLFLLFKTKLDSENQRNKLFIVLFTVLYVILGFIVFIFLPAWIFTLIEDWTYIEGVYYSFITLTTIGFGDFVSGKTMSGTWLYVYQISVILWIMTGLGYWVMVANFITRSLKSKRIHAIAKKAADIKKLMGHVGLAQADPKFLSQTSKATLNFMLQLSSMIAVPPADSNVTDGSDIDSGVGSPFRSPTSPNAPLAIPGIAALFSGAGKCGPSPFFTQLLGTGLVRAQQESSSKSQAEVKEQEKTRRVDRDEKTDKEKLMVFEKKIEQLKEEFEEVICACLEEDVGPSLIGTSQEEDDLVQRGELKLIPVEQNEENLYEVHANCNERLDKKLERAQRLLKSLSDDDGSPTLLGKHAASPTQDEHAGHRLISESGGLDPLLTELYRDLEEDRRDLDDKAWVGPDLAVKKRKTHNKAPSTQKSSKRRVAALQQTNSQNCKYTNRKTDQAADVVEDVPNDSDDLYEVISNPCNDHYSNRCPVATGIETHYFNHAQHESETDLSTFSEMYDIPKGSRKATSVRDHKHAVRINVSY